MKTARRIEIDFKPAPVAWAATAALACFVAAAVIVWAMPKGAGGNPRVEAIARAPTTESRRSDEPPPRPAPRVEEPGKARDRAVCAECGIVVSVQHIETTMQFTGWCDATEIARTQNLGNAFGRDFRADRESLHETVAAAIAATSTTTKDAMTMRHRIVVRMRNGSRQVFDESTPRMVKVGDRLVVIAGAHRSNG